METKNIQFMRVFDEEATYQRWQNTYNQAVTWEGSQWLYQPFAADGITAGDVSSESSLVVDIPCTRLVNAALKRAMRRTQLIEIKLYEFEIEPGQALIPDSMRLIALYVGEAVGLRGSFTTLQVELGSTLAPVGVQVPPRTYTTYLVGVPCQL